MIGKILRDEATLRRVRKEITQANNIINACNKSVEAAANDLCSKWAGAARDAFLAEQQKSKSWLDQMVKLVTDFTSALDKVMDTYNTVESAVSSVLKSK